MRHLIHALTLVFLVSCGQPTEQAGSAPAGASESDRLNAWFAEKNEERLAFSPLELTSLGRKDHYSEVDQMSVAAVEEQLDWWAASIDEMRRDFDYEALDFEARTSWDLWIYIYEQARDNHAWHDRDYVFDQMNGQHTGLPTFLINYHRVDTGSDMEAYIARIGGISRAIGQLLERAQYNAERGVRPPRFAYDLIIGESRKLINGSPFNAMENASPLWSDGLAKIDTLQANGIVDEGRAQALRDELRTALLDQYRPAYQALIDWFEQDLPNSDEEPRGAYHLPDGLAYYERMLKSFTTTDLSAEEIHAIGLAEVDRIMAEMEAVKDGVGFEGDMLSFFDFVSSDDQFFYPNTDAGRQQYLDDSAAYIKAIEARLPDYFGILPQAGLVVKRVEPFREQDGAAAHYYPSSPDGSIPGVYYAHLSDMKANPIPEMESTAYHEALPGHHMQIAIGLESESIPEFRGQYFFNAYVEGWALYAEQLAWEMGAYRDPYNNFGRLSNEMWRAVRLVVDTGMHAMGWSEQEAVRYFAAHTITPVEAIVSEIRRYLVWPGQATSYKIGMLKILELREKSRNALGDDFDIRAFHDVILGGGALPLEILERRVDNYIAEQG